MRALILSEVLLATAAVHNLHVNTRGSCGCQFKDDLATFAECVEARWLSGACPDADFGVDVQYASSVAEAGSTSLLLPHYPLPRGMKLAELFIPVKGLATDCKLQSVELGHHDREGFAPIVKYKGTEFYVGRGATDSDAEQTAAAERTLSNTAADETQTLAQVTTPALTVNNSTATTTYDEPTASTTSETTETTTVESTLTTTLTEETESTAFERSTDATEAETSTTGLATSLAETSTSAAITEPCTGDDTVSACGDAQTSAQSLSATQRLVSESEESSHPITEGLTASELIDVSDSWRTYTYRAKPLISELYTTVVAVADTPLSATTGTELYTSVAESAEYLLLRPRHANIDLTSIDLIRVALTGDGCGVAPARTHSLSAIYNPRGTESESSKIISF